MAEQDTLPPRKSQKFFFDTNNFDEDHEEIVEAEEEPPPVFSEEELAAAKEDAYEKGRQDGLDEAAKSRETHITTILRNIEASLPDLLAQENRREKTYEREAVSLAHNIFTKLFPSLNDAYGLEEIKNVITTVLEGQRSCPEIIIEVQPDYTDDIRELVERVKKDNDMSGIYTVKERPSLGPADCRLSWKDGGAKRDIDTLKQEIEEHLQQILADNGSMTDNSSEDKNAPNPIYDVKPDQNEPIPKNDGE